MNARRFSSIVLSLLVTTAVWSQSGDTEAGSLLKGTMLSTRLSGNVAVLKSGANGLGFYTSANTVTVSANTAYVQRGQTILVNLASLDNPLNAISVMQGETPVREGRYDLNGRPLEQEQRGVNIIRQQAADGGTTTKKVVVR